MQDSPLLGQLLLGYAPIVGAGGQVSGLRLALMPDQPQTRLDAAELLKSLAHAFPGEQTPGAGAPLQVLINIVSESLLDEFPGIGEARKQALLKRFGSVQRLRMATAEQIGEVTGFGERLAGELKAFLEARRG